jgi:hypothetical protein
MRSAYLGLGIALLLAPAGLLKADDTVTLTDGSVIKGQVMEETSDHVVLMDHGLKRTLDRSLVSSVSFNTGGEASSAAGSPASAAAPSEGGNTIPSAPANPGPDSGAPAPGGPPASGGGTVPSMPTQEQQDYALGLSDYYQVPPQQVWGYEDMGIPFEELPVIYYLARRAGVDPGMVADYRSSGASYVSICMRLGLSPDVFYWDDIYSRDLGGPYSGVYFRYHHFYGHWYWDSLALTDADIINLVNLRFTCDYWHRPYYEVARERVYGHPFFYISFGYSSRYGAPWRAHYGAGYGAGFSAYYGNRVSSGHGYFGGRVPMGGPGAGVGISAHANLGGGVSVGGHAGMGGPAGGHAPAGVPGGHGPAGGAYAGHGAHGGAYAGAHNGGHGGGHGGGHNGAHGGGHGGGHGNGMGKGGHDKDHGY